MVAVKRTEDYPISLPEPKTPRGKGIHVSSLIRCIATETGILAPQWADDLSLSDVREITDPTAILRINIGLAWEEHYIPMLEGVTDHPGQMQVDGIYMTHDGESVSSILRTGNRSTLVPGKRNDYTLKVHEVKATYKSTKTVGDLNVPNASTWMWMTQILAYCKGLGTRFAALHILYLCGDYSFPIKPVREVWEIEFTQGEVDQTWELLTDYRDHRVATEGGK